MHHASRSIQVVYHVMSRLKPALTVPSGGQIVATEILYGSAFRPGRGQSLGLGGLFDQVGQRIQGSGLVEQADVRVNPEG
jgi:hypothetical protein